MPYYNAILDDSARTMKEIAHFYFFDRMRIADVTFGLGGLWSKLDTRKYDLHASDLYTLPPPRKLDFAKLPYDSESYDCHILDLYWGAPPLYTHDDQPGRDYTNKYGIDSDPDSQSIHPGQVLNKYIAGMIEGKRILRRGGLMIVKSQDTYFGDVMTARCFEIMRFALMELHLTYETRYYQFHTCCHPCREDLVQRRPRSVVSEYMLFRKR